MRTYIPIEATLIPPHAERVFKGVIFDVWQWQQKMFDGSFATFEMLKRPDTTVAICVRGDKIVVLEEEQPHYGKRVGLPGGRADVEGEDELVAIKREVVEETGMRYRNWKLVHATQHWSKIDHFVYIFVATDFADQIDPNIDVGEKITVTEMTHADFIQAAKKGLLSDKLPNNVLLTKNIEELLGLADLYKT